MPSERIKDRITLPEGASVFLRHLDPAHDPENGHSASKGGRCVSNSLGRFRCHSASARWGSPLAVRALSGPGSSMRAYGHGVLT